jgi:hypothetical protein
MKCAIHQPQFLPWLGHFQKINMADVFVFLDNVQFRKNEFQNRNRICTERGVHWLTVPVTFRFGDTIREVGIGQRARWRDKMWRTVQQAYGAAPFFEGFAPGLKRIIDRQWSNLAEINMASVLWLMDCLGVDTRTIVASDLPDLTPDRTKRLVDICRHLGAGTYISGAQAECYLKVEEFHEAGIEVEFQRFVHPVYPQCNSQAAFASHLSAVDGLFNCGGGEQGRKLLSI